MALRETIFTQRQTRITEIQKRDHKQQFISTQLANSECSGTRTSHSLQLVCTYNFQHENANGVSPAHRVSEATKLMQNCARADLLVPSNACLQDINVLSRKCPSKLRKCATRGETRIFPLSFCAWQRRATSAWKRCQGMTSLSEQSKISRLHSYPTKLLELVAVNFFFEKGEFFLFCFFLWRVRQINIFDLELRHGGYVCA